MWVAPHTVPRERRVRGRELVLLLSPKQSALLLTEVLKEREAQIDLKERMRNATKDVEKQFLDTMKSREDEEQWREEERALQRKMEIQAVAENLRKQ